MTVRYTPAALPIATSEIGQFKGKVHRHFVVMARSHANHYELGIWVVQVEKRELPKDFRGPPIGDMVLMRNFVGEGWGGTGCGLPNVVIKCLDHLW
jgi:hypothetical protein